MLLYVLLISSIYNQVSVSKTYGFEQEVLPELSCSVGGCT